MTDRDEKEWQAFLRTVSSGGSILRDLSPADRGRMTDTVRDVNECFRDGWGPGRFDADDWRAGDRDYDQPEQLPELEDERQRLSWTLVRNALLWIAAFIGTSIVGFVFGVMVVRAFL
jgi:hypothetical protein